MKTFRILKDWAAPWGTVKAGTISRPYEKNESDHDYTKLLSHVEFKADNGNYREIWIAECLARPNWFEELADEVLMQEKIARLEKRVEELEAEKNRIVDIQSNLSPRVLYSDMPKRDWFESGRNH